MRERYWESEFGAAAERVKAAAARGIASINDRLVPAARLRGLRAARGSARVLRRCADLLDKAGAKARV